MRTFFTEFPVNPKKTADDFLGLCLQWIRGMPRRGFKWPEPSLLHLPHEVDVSAPAERMQMRKLCEEGAEGAGIRYHLDDDEGRTWITEAIWWCAENQPIVSIRVICASDIPILHLPTPRKPYLIKLLLRDGWGGNDGDLPVHDSISAMDRDQADHFAAIFSGRKRITLPVVYISRLRDGRCLLREEILAERLGGIAHVLVEENHHFGKAIAPKVNFTNPYLGAIAVYWPEGLGRRIYLPADFHSAQEMQETIYNDIVAALSNRRGQYQCSWNYLEEISARQAIMDMKRRGESDINAFLAEYENDMRAKERRAQEDKEAISRLEKQLKDETQREKGSRGITLPPEIDEFYNGEMIDIIISSLQEYMRNVATGTRREHVLSKILDANTTSHERDAIKNRIKLAFKGYTSMDAKIRAELREIGFAVNEDGKHFKLIFNDDPRYTFTLAKTPGDHRSGKNSASDIVKKLFG